MSALLDLLTDIDQSIALKLREDNPSMRYDSLKLGGIAKTVFDQKAGQFVLIEPGTEPGDSPQRVVCEISKYDAQIVHLLNGMDITGATPFGSLYRHDGELMLTLLACAKGGMSGLAATLFRALEQTPGVRIDGVNLDSFSVLTQQFRFVMNEKQNLDPLTIGVAIRYRVGRVDGADLLLSL